MSHVVGARVRLGALGATALLVSASMWLFVGGVAATDVGDDAALRAAWANPAETLISLTGDITLACTDGGIEPVGIDSPTRNSDTDIVVDGNGHTLHNPCNFDGLRQNGGGKVTIQDLTLTGNDTSDDGLNTDGDAVITGSSVTGHGDGGIDATGDVSVTGSTISGNGGEGIQSDGDVTVGDSEITANAVDDGCAGGINADGGVTVDASTVSGNGDNGIRAGGDITVSDSVVAGNGIVGECDEDGIQTESGTASVTRTTVSGNGVDRGGNGIVASVVNATASTITGNGEDGIRAGTANVTNSTITGHDGEGSSGIQASVDVNATHATITGNDVNINNAQGRAIHLFGTVLVDAGSANCLGPVADEGHNFIDDDTCGDIAENLDDPMLGALADNGGPTRTRLPAADSPLVDAIPSGDCKVTSEQRGLFTRPQGAGCEIGSVEVQGPPPPPSATPTAAPSPTPTRSVPPSASVVPSGSTAPTLPPTSSAATDQSAPATPAIVLVLALLAAVMVVGIERRRVVRRR